jgi:pSer/pThr/pTyr-binding forkhead associated (FHA) protein
MIVLQIADPSGERRIVHCAANAVVIGRSPECGVQLDHETVSKRHAEIVREADRFLLRDLTSYNGTYVNDRWITETPVTNGDRIKVGRFTITLLAPDVQTPMRPPEPVQAPAPASPPEPAARVATPARSRQLLTVLAIGLGTAFLIQGALLVYVLVKNARHERLRLAVTSSEPKEEPSSKPSLAQQPGQDSTPAAAESSPAPLLEPRAAAAPPSGAMDNQIRNARIELRDEAGPRPAIETPLPVAQAMPPYLIRFRDSAEPILRARCGSCHDGNARTRFLLSQNAPEPLRLRLNVIALLPFISAGDGGLPLLLARAIEPGHRGDAAPLEDEEKRALVAFLSDPGLRGIRDGAGTAFWAERPPFVVRETAVAPDREILLRRIYLDMIGRPPLEEELAACAAKSPAEVVQTLIRDAEFQARWNGDRVRALRECWPGEDAPADPEEAARRLTALATEKLASRPSRLKGFDQRAASLVIDLWNQKPGGEERALLEGALEASAPLGQFLPLVAFLLGRVEPPQNREAWVQRVFIRFLGRAPSSEELANATALLAQEGGTRGLVLGLASTDAYSRY